MRKKMLLFFITILSVICCLGIVACEDDNATGSYKVEYIVEDTTYHTGDIKDGVLTNIPQDPEVSGFVFDGWYFDNGVWEKPLTIQALLELPLSSNSFKVYAKLIKYTCNLDNKSHIFSLVEEINATCTSRGYKLERCEECGYEKNTILYALQHSYKNEITTPAKCGASGVRTYSCTRKNCDYSYTQPITALQHSYISEVTTQPTCTTEGVKTFTCTRADCSYSYTEKINELQHLYNSVDTIKPCIRNGLRTYTCTRTNCQYAYTEVLTALGYHDCDKNGNCIRCNAENVCSANFVADSDTLTGYNGNDTDVVIPSMFNGIVIVKLKNTFYCNETIQFVYIPDTIEEIGMGTFQLCTNLDNVRMPKHIKNIGLAAFQYTKITSIYLSKTLETIDTYAFSLCDYLSEIYYEGTKEFWDMIDINGQNNALMAANITYNYVREE